MRRAMFVVILVLCVALPGIGNVKGVVLWQE